MRETICLVATILTLVSCCSGFVIPSSQSELIFSRTLAKYSPLARKAVAVPPISQELNDKEIKDERKVQDTSEQIELEPEDKWVAELDYQAFADEVKELGNELAQDSGEADITHLKKIVRWREAAMILGIGSMWLAPNPFSIFALSMWTYASWATVGHHTLHAGYDRVNSIAGGWKYHSRNFASKRRRWLDWMDWMAPDAWNHNHNRMHHFRLNEKEDPDLVERFLPWLPPLKVAYPLKRMVVYLAFPIFKWAFFSPNIVKELEVAKWEREGKELPADFDQHETLNIALFFLPWRKSLRKVVPLKNLFVNCLGPFFFARFVLLPAPLLMIPQLGPALHMNAIINLLAAELLTNTHAFLTMVPNHVGNDVYCFCDGVRPRTPSFYVRQVVGSVNGPSGNDVIDFCHGFLNYQIEHHVWPDLSMRQYQLAAPRLKAICKKHGVPYVQGNVWQRINKTVNVMIGKTALRSFPTHLEPAEDKRQ